MALVIEYLIVVQKEEDFCKNEAAFINFLAVDTTIKPGKSQAEDIIVDLATNLTVKYSISSGEISDKKERFFNLKMTCDDDTRGQEFNKLTRKIKKIALKINPGNTEINTLQDDVGSMYAIQAYPLIHYLENQMRKLISKFMIINVGMEWFENMIHTDIKKPSEDTKQGLFTDFLQTVDFIELADVLFKAYRSTTVTEIDNYILKLKHGELADVDLLKDAMPKSNWERYFSDILKIDGEVLKDKWKKLYSLRNEVAHNRYFSKAKYDQLLSLKNSIQEPIEKALENLDRIKLTQQDVELITNSVTTGTDGGVILFKVIRELNIGAAAALAFLKGSGYVIENKLTAKITPEMYSALKKFFNP